MNKQSLNKFLIISLIFIWSIIAYKLISNFIGSEKIVENTNKFSQMTPRKLEEKNEVFVFTNIIRDPFLGDYIQSKKESPSVKTNYNKSSSHTKFWPTIEYYGFVRGEMSDNPLILLKINNNLERIRKGNRIDGLYIKDIFRDSILIVYGKEKKIIVKK